MKHTIQHHEGRTWTVVDERMTNGELDSSPYSQLLIRILRTASSATQSYPLISTGTIQYDLAQQVMQLLLQGGTNQSVQHLPVIAAIQNSALVEFLPTNDANLRTLIPHRELQYPSRTNTLPSFQSPFINPHLLPPFSATQMIEPQPNLQQLIQSFQNSNLIRQYQDHLSSQFQATIQQQTLVNHEAILSRSVPEESPIAAYLRSRRIVGVSRGNQSLAIPDPPPPNPPPGKILPQILAQPEDQSFLSEFQVLLRQNIEVFKATSDEVCIHLRGRNTPIYISQVGIRCIHCKHVPMARRQKGSMYFPSNTQRIYQGAQNMATAHMISGLCVEMPVHIKKQFQSLMTTRSNQRKAGRGYWTQSAETHLGLANTPEGIRATAPLL